MPLEETINQPSDTEKADDGTGQEKQEATSCQGKHESARRSTERMVEQGCRYRKLRTPKKALPTDTWAKEKKERATRTQDTSSRATGANGKTCK